MSRLSQAERIDRELEEARQKAAHDAVTELLGRMRNLLDAACRRHRAMPAPAPNEPRARTLIRQDLASEIAGISGMYDRACQRVLDSATPEALIPGTARQRL